MTPPPPEPVREAATARLAPGVAPSLLREMNQRLLYDRLFSAGPATRPQLARDTGLSQPTVIAALDDLERAGLAVAGNAEQQHQGRPAKLYAANARAGAVAGIDIGRGWLHLRVADLTGTVLGQLDVRNTANGAAALVDLAAGSLADATEKAGLVVGDVTHTAIGSPGVLDPRRGGVRYAANLPGWHEAGLAQALVERIGPSVSVDNDANLAALAEQRFGGHAGASDLICLTGEVGVGAGIILDGRLRRGGRGHSGEIGHVQLDRDGPGCHCGRRGCLEAMAGIGAVLRRVPSPAEVQIEVEEVVRLARAGDPGTLATLAAVGGNLGRGVSILANLLNPEVVILGGYYASLAPWLLPAVQDELSDRVIAAEAGGCQVVASTLGHDAAALGGAARVLDSIDSGRLPGGLPRIP
jgi:predicted NBD/HSP70 family sugar kinase